MTLVLLQVSSLCASEPDLSGSWAGGFGVLDGSAPRWSYVHLKLTHVGKKLRGQIRADHADNEFTGSLRGSKIEGSFRSSRRRVRFSGHLSENGTTVTGVAKYDRHSEPFRWDRLHIAREAPDYEGFYDGEDHRLLIRTSSYPGQLIAEDLTSGDIRLLVCQDHGHYTAGPTFLSTHPVTATFNFEVGQDGKTSLQRETKGEKIILNRREVFVSEDYSYRAPDGIEMKGTLFLPASQGAGPNPAIVWVHGSGKAKRRGSGSWPYIFAEAGFACLALDKRGVGESGGTYEMPDGGHDNPPHMARRAKDVRAAVQSLAKREEIDGKSIGLMGGSQAGWVIPQAANDSSVRFAILLSAGTTAFVYEGLYSDWAKEMESGPDAPPIEKLIERLRKKRPKDPKKRPLGIREHLVAMACPGIWFYGLKDRSNPSQICIDLLEEIKRDEEKDFTVVSFPGANHGLLECRFGGAAETGALERKVQGIPERIFAWLRERGIGGT